jgi:hypothetical protein
MSHQEQILVTLQRVTATEELLADARTHSELYAEHKMRGNREEAKQHLATFEQKLQLALEELQKINLLEHRQ